MDYILRDKADLENNCSSSSCNTYKVKVQVQSEIVFGVKTPSYLIFSLNYNLNQNFENSGNKIIWKVQTLLIHHIYILLLRITLLSSTLLLNRFKLLCT